MCSNDKLNIYVSKKDSAFYNLITWLDKKKLNFDTQSFSSVRPLKREILWHILKTSSTGFEEIVKKDKSQSLETLTFNQAFNYLLYHQNDLKPLLIVSQKKLMVGFNETEIYQLIPQQVRRVERKLLQIG
jgi:arsenate reductase-like glutaredoxin family protein